MKYVIIQEWDEGQKHRVTAYGQKTEKEINNLRDNMEWYSPYDYAVLDEYNTKDEFVKALNLLWVRKEADNIIYVNNEDRPKKERAVETQKDDVRAYYCFNYGDGSIEETWLTLEEFKEIKEDCAVFETKEEAEKFAKGEI